MAQTIIRRLSSSSLNLVEVGCGQGLFISRLVHEGEKRFASLNGFDPSGRGHSVTGGPHARVLFRSASSAIVSVFSRHCGVLPPHDRACLGLVDIPAEDS